MARLDKLFHNRRILHLGLVLSLLLVSLAGLTNHVWASTYIGLTQSNVGPNLCTANNCAPPSNCGAGVNNNALCNDGGAAQAPFTGTVTSVSLSVASNAPNTVILLTFPSGQNPIDVNNCSGPCSQIQSGETWTVVDQEGLSGLTTSSSGSFQTITLANPPSVVSGQWIAVVYMLTSGAASQIIMDCGNGGSLGSNGCPSAPIPSFFAGVCFNFSTGSPTGSQTTGSGLGAAQCSTNTQVVTGVTFTPQGQTGQTNTVTQCYGNCGTPAITLVNTNSTHTVNFNQSITLFYEFQSNLNGFVINASINFAKTYSSSSGQVGFLTIYTIPSCPLGQTPFSSSCPGLAQQGFNGGPPSKGRFTLTVTGATIPITNGEWLAVAFSCQTSGCDLNDTNTNVPQFQTNGIGPPVISQSSQTTCTCKTGAWLFIRGNVVSGSGPSQPSVPFCSGVLDCLLPQWAQSWCFNPTASCTNSGGILVALIVAIVSTFFLGYGGHEFMPTAKLPIGEIFMVTFLAWIFILTGVSVIFVWVPLFFFFVISVMFGKHTGRYL